MLNVLKPVSICVDVHTHRWLTDCAPIVIKETCEKMCKEEAAEFKASNPPKELAPYSFKACECQNILGKVNWIPGKWIWIVSIKRDKAKPADATDAGAPLRISFDAPAEKRKFFRVDPSLSRADFNREKFLAYRRAICEWNETDQSTRKRIKTDEADLPDESDRCWANLPERPDQADLPDESVRDRDNLPERADEADLTDEADAI